jgi:hypothetical protein
MRIIDLGAASVETRGPFGPAPEPGVIGQLETGLADE